MNKKDWSILVQSILDGDCVLMLGPDIPTEEKDISGCKPVIKLLEENLVKEIKKDKKKAALFPNSVRYDTFNDLAFRYSRLFSKRDLQFSVSTFFENLKIPCKDIYQDLAAIPFNLIINTSYDNLFVESLKSHGKKFQTDYYNYRGSSRGNVSAFTASEPLVYNLYGSIADNKSLVLSEDDMLDFLVNIIKNQPKLPPKILASLADKDKSFLFIGFGFVNKNWYFRILLHVLKAANKNGRSFALDELNPPGDMEAPAIVFFREQFRIEFIKTDIKTFVKTLRDRVEKQISSRRGQDSAGTPIPSVEARAPMAFICHAKEDHEQAKKLKNEFGRNNIKAWIFEEDMEPGETWELRLEKLISEEVDIFIFLHSRTSEKQLERFLNKEISLAEQRIPKFPKGHPFIYPCFIEEGLNPHKRFSQYQYTNLASKKGHEELIQALHKNFERIRHSKNIDSK